MYILGLWDGHDAGAALIQDNKILFASNEERYTKRKLEFNFPYNSIKAALNFTGVKPSEINTIAFPTTELTKTITRVFPYQMEVYYKFRRRKMLKPRWEGSRILLKYGMTTVGALPGTEAISKSVVSRHLKSMGFNDFKLYAVDHHTSHAATAAFTSGMSKSLVITMDGLGDGLCGTVSTFENGKLERRHAIKARDSIGIFYEQVTHIVGMRALEDEGKVMAMADYSYPFSFEENKLKSFFTVEGTNIHAKYGPIRQYDMLSRIAWSIPREQFSYMAQQLLENVLAKFTDGAVNRFGIRDIAMAGGLFSNVKANMKIRNLFNVQKWFVFPHMGDGGTALGAAMHANYMLNGTSAYEFKNAYLGDGFSDGQILEVLKNEKGIKYELDKDKAAHAAELINKDNYIFWFQGRMEYGPRALGDRSILANSGSESVKDKLNIQVKQREWYQPFAPSILVEDADKVLEDVKGYDYYMTMAYKVKDDKKDLMRSVVHVDMTARPQMVNENNGDYYKLLKAVKKLQGYGVVLNTSFNIHGMPIVLSPEDALATMKKTKTRYMFLGNYFVENKVVESRVFGAF